MGWRKKLKGWLGRQLSSTPLARVPVRVRGGLAKGARWTLLPYSAYWRGTYEQDVDAAVQSFGDLRGRSCWDLGTHYGIYTVGLAMRVGPTGHVAGFELDPVSFERCRRHVAMNRLDWVRLFNVGVSSADGVADIMKYGPHGTPTSHLAYPHEGGTGATRVPVKTVAIDSLVEAGEVRPPDFVKIDVEGHGGAAVAGAIRTITSSRPAMVIGFHSPEEYGRVKEMLMPLGYAVYDCQGGRKLGWPERYGDGGSDTYFLKAELPAPVDGRI